MLSFRISKSRNCRSLATGTCNPLQFLLAWLDPAITVAGPACVTSPSRSHSKTLLLSGPNQNVDTSMQKCCLQRRAACAAGPRTSGTWRGLGRVYACSKKRITLTLTTVPLPLSLSSETKKTDPAGSNDVSLKNQKNAGCVMVGNDRTEKTSAALLLLGLSKKTKTVNWIINNLNQRIKQHQRMYNPFFVSLCLHSRRVGQKARWIHQSPHSPDTAPCRCHVFGPVIATAQTNQLFTFQLLTVTVPFALLLYCCRTKQPLNGNVWAQLELSNEILVPCNR